MEIQSPRGALAILAVFVVAAAIGAGANLLLTAAGSSIWSNGLIGAATALIIAYIIRSVRRWKNERSPTRRSKLQQMEERWIKESEVSTTSQEQQSPSSEDQSE